MSSVNPVEDDAGNDHVRLLEHRLGAMQSHQLVRAGADHEERSIDDAAQYPAVGQTEHRWPVEDDTIVMVRQARSAVDAAPACPESRSGSIACRRWG